MKLRSGFHTAVPAAPNSRRGWLRLTRNLPPQARPGLPPNGLPLPDDVVQRILRDAIELASDWADYRTVCIQFQYCLDKTGAMDALAMDHLIAYVRSSKGKDSFQRLATSSAIARIRSMDLTLDQDLRMGGQSMLRSLKKFTSLRRLSLQWTFRARRLRLTDAEWEARVAWCLKALADAAPDLTSLEVYCDRASDMTSAGLACLAPLKRLQNLHLDCNRSLPPRPYATLTEGLVRVMPQLTALQHLSVTRCSAIDAAALHTLLAAGVLAPLKSLDLTQCQYVDDACLAVIAQLATLQRLRVGGCTCITDAGLQALAPLTALRYLDVSGYGHTTHEGHASLYTETEERAGLRVDCSCSRRSRAPNNVRPI